jgi:hypothetical protein
MAQQEADDVDVPGPGGQVQRGGTLDVQNVGGRFVSQQQLDHFPVRSQHVSMHCSPCGNEGASSSVSAVSSFLTIQHSSRGVSSFAERMGISRLNPARRLRGNDQHAHHARQCASNLSSLSEAPPLSDTFHENSIAIRYLLPFCPLRICDNFENYDRFSFTILKKEAKQS